MIHLGPRYHQGSFLPASFTSIVRWATDIAKTTKADAIAACGLSGLVLAGGVSHAAGIPAIAVRKASDSDAHDYNTVCGAFAEGRTTRYLIIDDLIASGATVAHILTRIAAITDTLEKRCDGSGAECIGVLLYNDACRPDMQPLRECGGTSSALSTMREALNVPVFVRPFDRT